VPILADWQSDDPRVANAINSLIGEVFFAGVDQDRGDPGLPFGVAWSRREDPCDLCGMGRVDRMLRTHLHFLLR
jgi:hypothetical protein